MLENEELIQSLKESKVTSEYIEERMKESKSTEDQIKRLHVAYTNATEMASLLYFTINKLRSLDYMYQFSLGLYISVVKKAIKEAEKNNEKNV